MSHDFMRTVFGGPEEGTSQSSSTNQAFPLLSQSLSPQLGNATGGSNSLAALLGVGGDPAAQQQAFSNWRNSTGYQFGLDQGVNAITGNRAAKGILNSGGTAKAIDTFGQNYANTQYQNYLNPLQSLIQSGNQAGQVLGSAGTVMQSSEKKQGSKKGMGDFIGQVASAIAL
jgi:hypothetical protein